MKYRPATSVRHSCTAVFLLLLGGVCWGQPHAVPISKEQATRIALAAANCKKPQDCVASGHLDKNNWVFVISFVKGRDTAGKPLFAPGRWVGITVDSEGHVIGRMAGE